MTRVITWVLDCGDGVCIERSGNERCLQRVWPCLSRYSLVLVWGGVVFAIEAALPKQADAAPARVAKTLKHVRLSAGQTILERTALIANGWRPAPEKRQPEERRLASVALRPFGLLGTGVGFCR